MFVHRDSSSSMRSPDWRHFGTELRSKIPTVACTYVRPISKLVDRPLETNKLGIWSAYGISLAVRPKKHLFGLRRGFMLPSRETFGSLDNPDTRERNRKELS